MIDENNDERDFPTCPHCEWTDSYFDHPEPCENICNGQSVWHTCPECGETYWVMVFIETSYVTLSELPYVLLCPWWFEWWWI